MNKRTPDLPAGTMIGPIKIHRILGKGATAHVYLATDQFGREVALKVRRKEERDADRRFLREFESLRRLAIPGVVEVFDAGQTDKWLWFTMEVVEGHHLFEYIQRATRVEERVTRAARSALSICRTLNEIHQEGLVHRDIKPSNIIVTGHDEIRIFDFGVVGWWSAGEPLTMEGSTVGTLPYMPPEQMAGHVPTSAVDIFSLGITLYEAVGGRRDRPKQAHSWIAKQILDRFQPLAIKLTGVSRAFSAIIDRCLSLDPNDRPTAKDLCELFEQVLAGEGPPAWPESHLFVGRDVELAIIRDSFNSEGAKFHILSGVVGSGRRRLMEQARRYAIMTGHQTFRVRCYQDQPGGAVCQLLQSMLALKTPAEIKAFLSRNDAQVLLSMWPSLPLHSAAGSRALIDVSRREVVKSAAQLILNIADKEPLLIAIHELEDIGEISHAVFRALLATENTSISIIATLNRRNINLSARKFVDRQEKKGVAVTIELGPIPFQAASDFYQSIVIDGEHKFEHEPLPIEITMTALAKLATIRGESYPEVCKDSLVLIAAEDPLPGGVLHGVDSAAANYVSRGLLYINHNKRFAIPGPHLLCVAQHKIENRREIHSLVAQAWSRWTDGGDLRWLKVAEHTIRANSQQMDTWESVVKAAVALTRVGRLHEARKWLLHLDTVPRDPESEVYKKHRFDLAFARATVAHSCDTERIRKDLVTQASERSKTEAQKQYVAVLEAQQLAREGHMRRAIACAVAGAAVSRVDNPDIACRLILQTASMRLELEQFYDIEVGISQLEALSSRIVDRPILCEINLLKARYKIINGKTIEAIGLSLTGLDMARSCDYQKGEAGFMLVLAQGYLHLGKRRQAHRYARNSFQLYTVLGIPSNIASAMVVLAESSLSRGETKAAYLLALHATSTAEKLSLKRLLARSLDITICVQAMTGEWADAEQTLARRRGLGNIALDSKFGVELYYWRLRDRPTEARKVSLKLPKNNWYSIWGRLELFRCLVQNGTGHEIKEELAEQTKLAKENGYLELEKYGNLLSGAVNPHSDDKMWGELRNKCRFAAWVELFLGSIEFDARRLNARFEAEAAVEQANNLRLRSVDLSHAALSSMANKLIEELAPSETKIVYK